MLAAVLTEVLVLIPLSYHSECLENLFRLAQEQKCLQVKHHKTLRIRRSTQQSGALPPHLPV